MLRWSQDELAEKAGVSKQTVTAYEREARKPMRKNLEALRLAFEAAGIIFIEEDSAGAGVRFAAPRTEVELPEAATPA